MREERKMPIKERNSPMIKEDVRKVIREAQTIKKEKKEEMNRPRMRV